MNNLLYPKKVVYNSYKILDCYLAIDIYLNNYKITCNFKAYGIILEYKDLKNLGFYQI